MSYSYARINLDKTDYSMMNSSDYQVLPNPDPTQLNEIYYKYCHYHKFNRF